MQENMCKDKLKPASDLSLTKIQYAAKWWRIEKRSCLVLTWIWLQMSLQMETNPRTHIQIRIQKHEFDLSLTKFQYTTEKTQERMCKVKLNLLNATWISLKLNLQLKSIFQIQAISNLLNLAWVWPKLNLQLNQGRSACTTSKLICWAWLEFH